MLSAERIVEIFRTRGGGTEFDRPAQSLPPDHLAYVKALAGGEPIIAKLSSENEWLVLTETHFVIERSAGVHRVPLTDIHQVDTPKRDFMNPQIKIEGGDLDVRRRNSSTLRINVQPGVPYFGLMNVLMRIATLNRRRNSKGSSIRDDVKPTTNDRRPTT